MFAYRIQKYIGAYMAVVPHLDAIVFTAGIGQNSSPVRERICTGLEHLGLRLDLAKNAVRSDEPRAIQQAGPPSRSRLAHQRGTPDRPRDQADHRSR
jgi:acetate kinase